MTKGPEPHSGKHTLTLAAQALSQAAEHMGDDFDKAVRLLGKSAGKIVVTGVGKSAHIAAKIAATLNSTGSSAMFLHAGEALHGDLGAVQQGDVVVCLSKSGRSDEVTQLLPSLVQRDCPLVALTADPGSPLGMAASVVLDVSVPEEACPLDLAPTTSTTLQLAMGDALAVALMAANAFQAKDFAANHPAGSLGKKLTWTLASLVDPARKPAVPWDASMADMLEVMSEARYGATVVWAQDNPGQIGGIVTDGDLRRAMAKGVLTDVTAGALASPHPHTMQARELAAQAVGWMKTHSISQVVVMEGDRYAGMVHLHDCLREGLG